MPSPFLETTSRIRTPTPLESDLALPGEDPERGSPGNYSGSSLLAVSNMVPYAITFGDSPSSFSVSRRHTNHHDTDAMTTSASMETLLLAALRASSSTPRLTVMSTSLLQEPRLTYTTTNKSYKRGQTIFIE